MPIPTTLEQQFSSLSTEDRPEKTNVDERITVSPPTTHNIAALVTPTKRDNDSLTSEEGDDVGFLTPSTVGDSSPVVAPASVAADDRTKSGMLLLRKTEQKLREERGELTTEPLLKENPQRFVIFPIQDNDVSMNMDSVSLKTLCCHDFATVWSEFQAIIPHPPRFVLTSNMKH